MSYIFYTKCIVIILIILKYNQYYFKLHIVFLYHILQYVLYYRYCIKFKYNQYIYNMYYYTALIIPFVLLTVLPSIIFFWYYSVSGTDKEIFPPFCDCMITLHIGSWPSGTPSHPKSGSIMWTTHWLKPMGFLLHRPRNLLTPQA